MELHGDLEIPGLKTGSDLGGKNKTYFSFFKILYQSYRYAFGGQSVIKYGSSQYVLGMQFNIKSSNIEVFVV